MTDLAALEREIGYVFKDKSILKESLLHPSLKKHHSELSYERLEFLGDSVLSLVISDILYKTYPTSNEGGLSKRHTNLVCSKTLVNIANKLGLGAYIVMDLGEEHDGGKTKNSNLENGLEALIGAIYIDGGYESAYAFVKIFWYDLAKDMVDIPINSRSLLQEWSQKKGIALPEYKIIKKEGLDHDPVFTVSLKLADYPEFLGTAKSKKAAEYKAADKMIQVLKISK
ncbi:ribonuclease III [Anaplasmataceae bacterium AB001_6]|nr:ribonuclease III [Anaplasmataceae bacterium AB001_6]